MTRLIDALRALGLDGELTMADHWVTLRGERCLVYVAEAARGGGYYTWCDEPGERTIEHYPDPIEAIRAGLRRATRREGADLAT